MRLARYRPDPTTREFRRVPDDEALWPAYLATALGLALLAAGALALAW
jgi:hypothetical protein